MKAAADAFASLNPDEPEPQVVEAEAVEADAVVAAAVAADAAAALTPLSPKEHYETIIALHEAANQDVETLCDRLAAAENDLVTTPGAKPHTVTIDGASFVLAAGPEADESEEGVQEFMMRRHEVPPKKLKLGLFGSTRLGKWRAKAVEAAAPEMIEEAPAPAPSPAPAPPPPLPSIPIPEPHEWVRDSGAEKAALAVVVAA